ncbi:hypothetical protein AUJ68_01205 [Candidatus Woesearchaeota archaeon CG1_02_57_44]|nr:MAG: hypothetical protein AUJ68_01205 [Candidatus Woesearchaeota archaeon CG1_02_57_44]PIN68392.1 MAG: 50S ribosomal protein L34e [Candidatus Woesearchaeota archaeon CG11_big_fil_rev_8_21_14_0_20_57_5]
MPTRAQRSGHYRKTKVRLPGGSTETHYTPHRPKQATCGTCGAKLHGVPRALPAEIKRIAKSSLRPTRAYGGTLCSKCSREALKAL